MLDPKARVRTDDGGAPFEWMSIPSVKEVAIQPATTDIFLQPAVYTEKNTDTLLTTRFVVIIATIKINIRAISQLKF